MLKGFFLLVRIVFEEEFGEFQLVSASSGRKGISVQTLMAF
jgi:hypothetical protein